MAKKLELLGALREEETIWKLVYSHRELDNRRWRVYWYEKFPEMPHWNAAYPIIEQGIPHSPDLEAIRTVYRQHGLKGNILVPNTKSLSAKSEEHEYFLWDRSTPVPTVSRDKEADRIEIVQTQDLGEFVQCVQLAFDLVASFRDDFQSQLTVISRTHNATHWVAKVNGVVAGCLSAFRTDGGYDFVMNFGVKEEYRSRGLAPLLLTSLMRATEVPIIVRTEHPKLRQSVLPRAGFQSLGTCSLTPLDDMN